MKSFNITGPCDPARHYMIPATQRLAEANISRLIEHEAYFVVHAPKQFGKTTEMQALASELTESGKYVAALVSMMKSAGISDVGAAEEAVLHDWQSSLKNDLPEELQPPAWTDGPPGHKIGGALSDWAENSPRPLVLFLDEMDSLEEWPLISVLAQLRSGHTRRPEMFPSSLALIGLHEVYGYRSKPNDGYTLGSPVPFNIVEEFIRLRSFSADEVKELLAQHTAQTGQAFTEEASQLVFDLTQGQPWLVNALAKVCVEELVGDPNQPINAEHIERAKGTLIERRETHLDQLADSLCEERVRRVIEPKLVGEIPYDATQDDFQNVLDLGLCRKAKGQPFEIANPIYHELATKMLSATPRHSRIQRFAVECVPLTTNCDAT